MKTIAIIFIASFCSYLGFSQKSKIKLTITESTIYAKDNLISINTELSNEEDTSLIFFDYLALEYPFAKEKKYYTRNITAGMTVFLKDNKGSFLYVPIPNGEPVENHPTTIVCEKNYSDSVNEYVARKVIVKSHSTVENKLCFDLFYCNLKKGTYKLFLLYYSGDYITNIIDESEILEISKKNNASVFKGHLKSNEVKLVVE